MRNGIRSLPRYQQGGGPIGPSRREFLRRMASGIGGLWASRFGGAEKVLEGMASPPTDLMSELSRPPFWAAPQSQGFFTSIDRVKNIIPPPMYEVIAHDTDMTPTHFMSRRTGEIMPFWRKGGGPAGFNSWMDLAEETIPLTPDMRASLLEQGARLKPGEILDPRRFLDKAGVMSGSFRLPPGTSWEENSPLVRAVKDQVVQMRRFDADDPSWVPATGGEQRGGKPYRRGIRGLALAPEFNRPGILDSPVAQGWSTYVPTGGWMGRAGRGLLMGLGALGGSAVDILAAPTQLGSGDVPEESRFSPEEKMKYYDELTNLGRELGVGQHRPSILQLSREMNGPSIRSSYPMGR